MDPRVTLMARSQEVPELVLPACAAGQDVVGVVGFPAAHLAAPLGTVEAPGADLPPVAGLPCVLDCDLPQRGTTLERLPPAQR